MNFVAQYGSLEDPVIRKQLQAALDSPKNWTIYMVKQNGKVRTPAQNRLYQITLRKFSQQLGKSVEYWDEYLIEKFLGWITIRTEDGYSRKVLPSTAELTVDEFAAFLNAILAFAAEMQVH